MHLNGNRLTEKKLLINIYRLGKQFREGFAELALISWPLAHHYRKANLTKLNLITLEVGLFHCKTELASLQCLLSMIG